jgi:uncharacterized membrane protein YcaP (DUF421 family)
MEIVARSAAVFALLWLVTRALGKRELSEITSFELLLLVIMGDLVQQGVTQEDTSITGAALAVGTMAIMILLTGYAGFRWRRARRIVEGLPVMVVRDGRPLEEVLRVERVSLEELLAAARQQGIGDLEAVRVAVLETDGRFSFIVDEGPSEGRPPERTAR